MKRFVSIVILTLLTACAQLGIAPADTFNKKLAAGYVTVQTVAEGTTSLLKAQKISKGDAQNVAATNVTALTALDTAADMSKTNIGAADTKLTATIGILTALQAYLATKGAK